MKASEWLSSFPKISFKETWKDRIEIIRSLKIPNDQIKQKEEEYSLLFDYDYLLSDLKNILTENIDLEIDDRLWIKITFHINQINSLVTQMNNLNLNQKSFVQIIKNFINYITQNRLLNNLTLNVNNVNTIQSPILLIENYIFDIKDILLNFNSDDLDLKEIKKLRKEIEEKSANFEKSLEISNTLIDNQEKYNEAIKIANTWIDTNSSAVETFLENQATTFWKKAEEHSVFNFKMVELLKIKGILIKQPSWKWSFIWLLLSFLFWFLIIWMLFYFLNEKWLEIWDSIIRIGTILVPTYFLLFSSQQFVLHKKLYESYKFKDI